MSFKSILLFLLLIGSYHLYSQTNLNGLVDDFCECYEINEGKKRDKCFKKVRKENPEWSNKQYDQSEIIEFTARLGERCEKFKEELLESLGKIHPKSDESYTREIEKLEKIFKSIEAIGNGKNMHIIDILEVGVLYDPYSGGTQLDTILKEGTHLLDRKYKVIKYNLAHIKLHDSINVLSSDGLDVPIEFRFFCKLRDDSIPKLHKSIGKNYQKIIIEPNLKSALRTVIGRYSATELFHSDRLEIQNEIMDELDKSMYSQYFQLNQFYILRLETSPHISQIIENGLENEYSGLKSNSKEDRIKALKNLFYSKNKLANVLFLNHWSTEKDVDVLETMVQLLVGDK